MINMQMINRLIKLATKDGMPMKDAGRYIKWAREEARFETAEELARYANVSVHTIRSIEQGRRKATENILEAIIDKANQECIIEYYERFGNKTF